MHAIEELRPVVREELPSCETVTLTLRKPKAVMFADAPAVSLVRTVKEAVAAQSHDRSGLDVIKPYV